MTVRIEEIELNFCNVCSGRCFICATAHGRGNVPMMLSRTFAEVVNQLKTIEFSTIQTSGNGDCFLNSAFLNYLQTLRGTFPAARIVNYSNFALYEQDAAHEIVRDHLLDEQFTRIDSLDPAIFSKSTGLNAERVFRNLDHFIRRNNSIKLTIGYSSIPQYYRKCRKVLGQMPFHGPFDLDDVDEMADEYDAIQERFGSIPTQPPVNFYRINQSLWAERENPSTAPDPTGQCPKYAAGLLDRICWICPNGDVSVCGYDDEQSRFICGNILEEPLADIWQGERRREILRQIAGREWKRYPCNPACCRQYGDGHA